MLAMEERKQILPVWNGPVFRKPRLPKAFSWVIGVERLSDRFGDVPQFHNLMVWFDDHTVASSWRVTMTKASSGRIPQQVFAVWYTTNLHPPRWYFMVYPVEADRRSHVRQLLEEQAFPIVAQWMKADRPETWFQSDKHLRCIWDRVA